MTSTPNDVRDVGAIKEHAFYCFDTIYSKLNHTTLSAPSFDTTLE